MAKSLRSKREKRLRAIRRELVEPHYVDKEAAKDTALQAALNAPKLPVRDYNSNSSMDLATTTTTSSTSLISNMDVEMADGNQGSGRLKAVGGVGKKMKKKLKLAKGKNRSNRKIRRKHV